MTARLLCVFLICLLAGCGGSPSKRVELYERPGFFFPKRILADDSYIGWHDHFKSPTTADILQDYILQPHRTSFDRVMVAKILVNGTELDVTSLGSRIFNSVGEFDKRAVSGVRFSDDLRELTFFTRHPLTGEGFRAILPVSKAAQLPAFDFPIIVDNTIQPATIKVASIQPRPASTNPLDRHRFKGILSANNF